MSFTADNNQQNTHLIYGHETHISSQLIYSTSLVSVLAGICLPFLYTTISVTGADAIQSNMEKTELLYRNPEILILDEATSSLDSASEQYVQRTIEILLQQQKTIIIIAHRLTTIKNANKIIVLDKGKVVEEENHQEMILTKGYYSKMWQEQFA